MRGDPPRRVLDGSPPRGRGYNGGPNRGGHGSGYRPQNRNYNQNSRGRGRGGHYTQYSDNRPSYPKGNGRYQRRSLDDEEEDDETTDRTGVETTPVAKMTSGSLGDFKVTISNNRESNQVNTQSPRSLVAHRARR